MQRLQHAHPGVPDAADRRADVASRTRDFFEIEVAGRARRSAASPSEGAVTPSPTNADSGRGELFRSLPVSAPAPTRRRSARRGVRVRGIQARPPIMLAGPLAVVAVVLVVIAVVRRPRRRRATSTATLRDRWGSSTGRARACCRSRRCLARAPAPVRALDVPAPCPAAPAHRRDRPVRLGGARGGPGLRLAPARPGALANRFTLCVADLDPSLPTSRVSSCTRAAGCSGAHSDWLGAAPVRRRGGERGLRRALRAARGHGQDEHGCASCSPRSLVVWLANHPLAPGFELTRRDAGGVRGRPLEDAGNLTYLIDATRHLAGRVAGEVGEEAGAPGRHRLPAHARVQIDEFGGPEVLHVVDVPNP